MIKIILLITSLMLMIMSAWSVSTFIKLKNASKQYDSDYKLESACRLSKQYVKNGLNIGIFILVLSVILLFTTCVILFKSV